MSNLKVFSLSPIISEIFYNTSLTIFPSVLRTETKISDWQNSFLSKLEVFKMPKDWHSDKIILANAGSPIIEACVHLFEKMLIFWFATIQYLHTLIRLVLSRTMCNVVYTKQKTTEMIGTCLFHKQ